MAPKKVKQDFYHYREGKLHFFCPLCHYHQSTNTIRKIGQKHFAQLALVTSALTLVGWNWFGWKGLFLFFPLWLGFELVYRLRKRQALICQSCGFDPFLYKQDIRKARAALKEHWQRKIETENLFAGKKLKNYKTNPAAEQKNLGAARDINENAALSEMKNAAEAQNLSRSP